MERVVILGSGGAGKSTLARKISAKTGLPVVHLDLLFWRRGWTPAPTEEAHRALAEAIAGDRWILDGNFLWGQGGDATARFERADTVVFLDRSRWTCLRRLIGRRIRHRRGGRSDLPPGCRESVDLGFLRWVWQYPTRERPRVLELLRRLDPAAVYHLGDDADVERFLAGLR